MIRTFYYEVMNGYMDDVLYYEALSEHDGVVRLHTIPAIWLAANRLKQVRFEEKRRKTTV